MNKKIKISIYIYIFLVIIAIAIFQLYNKNIENMPLENEIGEVNEENLNSKDSIINVNHFSFTDETSISLLGEKVQVVGNGVKVEENTNTIEITKSGNYRIKGKLENGRIVVNAKYCNVNLILDNVDITCLYSAPIYVYKSNITMITLENNTINTLTDGSKYNFQDKYSSSVEEEPNACIYSKSDLILYGTGSIVVNANNNAITSKDKLHIENANIIVNSNNHGINGKDSNVIKNANINITSKGDGIRATNDVDVELGWIRIEDSEITINASEDAIQAETDLIIYGGKYNIITGKIGVDEISQKGLKAGKNLFVKSADVNIDSFDDAIHSNGSIRIASGNYVIKTNNDGIYADYIVTIDDGNIDILESYEGIEGNDIITNGGNINITADDEKINKRGR